MTAQAAAATSERRYPVKNPRTGVVDYSFAVPSADEIGAICRDLRAAQVEWAAAPLEHRIAVMRRWADRIDARKADLGRADAQDTGGAGISRASPMIVMGNIRGWCARAPEVLAARAPSGKSGVWPNIGYATKLTPYPLLGVISPWNAPLMLSTIDAIPALIAGCAVIVKPSEVTPRFIEVLMETIRDVPELARVLRFIAGDGATGQAIIDNADIVCFTGSVPTGRKVAEACARRFIPVFLELGGKDPVIVTAGADLDRAATAIVRGALSNAGQVCFSVERVYVDARVHDAFIEALKKEAAKVEFKYPDPDKGQLGPFIFDKQAAIVDGQLDDAVAKGATIVTGGKSMEMGGGRYMAPTILTGINHDMRLMQDETFGPVIPVMKFASVDEAIRLANDSAFGLSASVFAKDDEEARAIAEHLEAGTICLQDCFLTLAKTMDVETTSFKFSGLGGSRTGPGSIMRFFRKRAFMTNSNYPMDLKTFE